MENENVKNYWQGVEEFFANFSNDIVNFSSEHALLIEKYPYNSVAWNLRFSHPKGGEGFIKLGKGLCNTMSISGHWYLEDVREDKRYIRNTAPVYVPVSLKELFKKYLTRELRTVATWESGNWSSVVNDYRRNMAPAFKEAYLNRTKNLLEPRIVLPIADVRSNPDCVVVVCSACKYENEFKQPYPYSAGMGDQIFLYNDDGMLTLTWSLYDKAFMKLCPQTMPWDEQMKIIEDSLLPSPHGGKWRFDNPARCLACKTKISEQRDGQYLVYNGSIETEKLDGGFLSVLKSS